jgi:hypothetical protein
VDKFRDTLLVALDLVQVHLVDPLDQAQVEVTHSPQLKLPNTIKKMTVGLSLVIKYLMSLIS